MFHQLLLHWEYYQEDKPIPAQVDKLWLPLVLKEQMMEINKNTEIVQQTISTLKSV